MSNKAANNIMKRALNSPIWQAKKGIGSFITFDMGNKIERKKRDGTVYLQGSIHFWIYLCDWTILSDGNEIANSNSEDIKAKIAIDKFVGKTIKSIQIKNQNELLIDVSESLSIKLTANENVYSKSDDFFILYTDHGTVSYSEESGLSIDE